MKTLIHRSILTFICAAVVAVGSPLNADVVVEVNKDANWQGFMSVFDLDRSGALPAPGAFQFGSGWGVADLTAEFDNTTNELTLGPNSIGDPDPFWYIGGGAPGALGNKWMDANAFVQETDTFAGMNVTFEGTILSNSFTANHTATIFIRDFAPDFSSFNETTTAVTAGDFSITLATDPGAGRHVQYGFNVAGENVWVTDRAPFGFVGVQTVPEPGSMAVLALGGVLVLARRKKS